MQNKKTNFETDLLFPIIEYASAVSGVTYGEDEDTDVSLKVIADHARSMTIMIMDGILPSNEGRGYVLRRILRRAIRHGRMLGIETKFLTGAVDAVLKIYNGVFAELVEKQDYIKKVISLEEDRFHTTLVQGMELLSRHIEQLKTDKQTVLSGKIGFKLYDTFGFPWELTDEILHENDMTLNKDAFDRAMQEQRQRARAARHENTRVAIPDLRGLDTEKLLLDPTAKEAKIVCIWKDGKMVDSVNDDEEAGMVFDITPFYAEGGGQIGDAGILEGEFGKVSVSNTKKLPNGTVYHIGYVEEGIIKVGDTIKIELNEEKKLASARNHTATHLLQAALKTVVGEHVNQAGSSVTAEHLRFDFSSFEPVSKEQLQEVESIVNAEILKGTDVEICQMSQMEAKAKGAMALFGEKYGDIVRVVSVADFSMELCGGSHVKNVGQIGLFKIMGESGVASGVRRIEAVTGKASMTYANKQIQILQEISDKLKARPEEAATRVDAVLSNIKDLEQELTAFNETRAKEATQKLLQSAENYGEVQVVIAKATASDMDELRNIADRVCDQLTCGAVVLAAVNDGKVSLVVKVSKAAVAKGVHAGKIIKDAAKIVGGGGGGRPDMAQAGGKVPENLADAFSAAAAIIKEQIH